MLEIPLPQHSFDHEQFVRDIGWSGEKDAIERDGLRHGRMMSSILWRRKGVSRHSRNDPNERSEFAGRDQTVGRGSGNGAFLSMHESPQFFRAAIFPPRFRAKKSRNVCAQF